MQFYCVWLSQANTENSGVTVSFKMEVPLQISVWIFMRILMQISVQIFKRISLFATSWSLGWSPSVDLS